MKYLTGLLVCLSCNISQADEFCLDAKAVNPYKVELESIIDRLPSAPQEKVSQMLRTACYKQVYARGGFSFTIFKDPADPVQNLSGEISSHITSPSEVAKCWADAKAELVTPQFSWAIGLLRSLSNKYPWRIDDPDIGPSKYLACENRDTPFYDSISVMLHETIHTMSAKKCLFNSFDSDAFCFNLGADLPLRSLGKFEGVPLEIAAFYEPVQHLYMEIADQPILDLFNELNAYIVSAKTESSLLRNNPTKVIPAQGSRSLINLPLFLFYAANYMEKLRVQEPLKSTQNFGMQNPNKAELLRLLVLGEKAFQEFQHELEAAGGKLYPAEAYFWKSYRQLKASL